MTYVILCIKIKTPLLGSLACFFVCAFAFLSVNVQLYSVFVF